MFTTEQIAEKFGVEKTVAYGFLRFLAEAGIVETGRAAKVEGRKGKPATLYKLEANTGEKLSQLLVSKFVDLDANVSAVQVDEVATCCVVSTEPVV